MFQGVVILMTCLHSPILTQKLDQFLGQATYCILLADYFDIKPNDLLQLAGWPALHVFEIKRASIDNLPPEAVDVALDIAKIPDPSARKQVAEVIRVFLKKDFQ